ncbi:MAG: pyridoxamine 5'-phosphate oxidase [Hyphomonas sp.]|uniref:pyridoxamine 5'-phosphate oxidase n=1 Tax=Hyphomonas sp. TaxID=87 RepID=UPI003527C7A0
MTSKIIPPTPSTADYASHGDRPLIADMDDPFALFEAWMAEARESEPNDCNAMSLATVDAKGMPDVRILLLKDVAEGGFTFYTNLESAKGEQLRDNPVAALCFHWKTLRRQVRVRGTITRVSNEEADAYFASRAAQSRIGAIASDQSRPLPDRAIYEQRVAEVSEVYGDGPDIPRPDFWGGYRLTPVEIEFWQDQAFRMHDRLKFHRDGNAWRRGRLYP